MPHPFLKNRPDTSGTPCTAVIRWLRPEFKFPAKIEMAFSQMLAIRSWYNKLQCILDKKQSHINAKNILKMALNSGVQTYQILTNDDEGWIPRHSSISLAVPRSRN